MRALTSAANYQLCVWVEVGCLQRLLQMLHALFKSRAWMLDAEAELEHPPSPQATARQASEKERLPNWTLGVSVGR